LEDNDDFRNDVEETICINPINYTDLVEYLKNSFCGEITVNGKKVSKSRSLITLFHAIGNEQLASQWLNNNERDVEYRALAWFCFQLLLDKDKGHWKNWVRTYYFGNPKGRIYLKSQDEIRQRFSNPQ